VRPGQQGPRGSHALGGRGLLGKGRVGEGALALLSFARPRHLRRWVKAPPLALLRLRLPSSSRLPQSLGLDGAAAVAPVSFCLPEEVPQWREWLARNPEKDTGEGANPDSARLYERAAGEPPACVRSGSRASHPTLPHHPQACGCSRRARTPARDCASCRRAGGGLGTPYPLLNAACAAAGRRARALSHGACLRCRVVNAAAGRPSGASDGAPRHHARPRLSARVPPPPRRRAPSALQAASIPPRHPGRAQTHLKASPQPPARRARKSLRPSAGREREPAPRPAPARRAARPPWRRTARASAASPNVGL
jgi:hypothetical protein